MSDTPRTDAAANDSIVKVYETSKDLERELAEMRKNATEPIASQATENIELTKQRDAMQSPINTFCEGQDWSDSAWKKQPHIAELFNLRKP